MGGCEGFQERLTKLTIDYKAELNIILHVNSEVFHLLVYPEHFIYSLSALIVFSIHWLSKVTDSILL